MESRRVAVRGIILKDGELLAVRHKKHHGAAVDEGKDFWCTPGGSVERGEPLVAALERELIEELGIKPVVGKLLYIQQFNDHGQERLEFFFHVTNSNDYCQVHLNDTTHGIVELAEVDFIDTHTHTVLPVFLRKQDLSDDAAQGTTKIFDNFRE